MDIKKEVEDDYFDTSIVKEEFEVTETTKEECGNEGGVTQFIITETIKEEPVDPDYVKIEQDSTYEHSAETSRDLDSRAFSCSQCFKAFKTKGHLKRHELTHTEDRPKYSCSGCGKIYKVRACMENHVCPNIKKKMRESTRHVCTTCNKDFKNPQTLKKHEFIHLPVEDRPIFACNLCPRTFKWSKNLAAHRKICVALQARTNAEAPGINVRIFECALCGKQCLYKQEIKSHMWVHVKHRPKYACKRCGNKYNTTQYLGQHEKVCFTKEDLPLEPCPKCGNKFHTMLMMIQHYNMCKEKCPSCGKRLKCKCLSEVKKQVYTERHRQNKRTLTCGVCGNSYHSFSYMKQHQLKCNEAMGPPRFTCKTCGRKYHGIHSLINHQNVCKWQERGLTKRAAKRLLLQQQEQQKQQEEEKLQQLPETSETIITAAETVPKVAASTGISSGAQVKGTLT